MFHHSVRVPRLYKVAANIAKDVKEGVGSVKQLVYENKKKHPVSILKRIKALYALVATLFQKSDEIESLLKRSQFLIKEPRSNPWLIKVLIVELLWGKFIMVEESDVLTENAPLLPPHTKQAAKAMSLLLFFSFLMFSLPFGAFFAVKYLLRDYFDIDGYANTVWSVFAAVLTVNLVIFGYAYIAYHDPEYDDDGNLIEQSKKSDLNLKQD
ncbi:hypothetical protein NQ314_008748 [Rhamnusium bicolor]|uniref:NSUN5/RCM1 N-terminal domain-containing protein n=1 Tax=Rhamnusium bicolor TaxID=1586634 RepID=A0AAV8Y667_9CUCU|nr:hypothetical protein NQ314_008748 [Rhamnusium bicolor]